MTLQNLAKIGQLKPHVAEPAEVQRLLAAIERNLADAGVTGIHDETRFDCLQDHHAISRGRKRGELA